MEKNRLRQLYNSERKTFDKILRSAKRKYQHSEQERLKTLYTDNDTRGFWKYIGKLGLQNERKPDIPMEIIDNDGNVSTRLDDLLSR